MSSAAAAGVPETRRLFVNFAVMLPTVMHSVDITIATVALPTMQGSLSATQDQIAWVLTCYVVAVAIMTPATGWVAARLGRRRLFLISVTGFTAVSVLCGLSGSLGELLVFRFLQGGFGACLIPLSQSVVLDTYPRREHGKAMAIWGVGVMAGPLIGPTLGGYLTEFYGWHWVFFINLPIGALALTGIVLFVPETERDSSRTLDVFGFAALAIGLGCLQLVLDRGERLDWFADPEIVLTCVAAVLGLYWYVVHSMTTDRPFLSPQLFRDRNFVVGLSLGFIAHLSLYATVALIPTLLQHVLAYPVMTSGFLFVPRAGGTLLGMATVGRLAGRMDPRGLIAAGMLIAAYGLWEMTRFSLDVPETAIIWSGLVLGFGLGLAFTPVSTVAFSTLPSRLRTEGAGVYAVVRSMGASLGISIFVTLLVRNAQANRAALVGNVSPFNSNMRGPNIPEVWDPAHAPGLSSLSNLVDRQAEMIAYVHDFWALLIITVASAPLAYLMTNPLKLDRDPSAKGSTRA